jgi:hypothetical protein
MLVVRRIAVPILRGVCLALCAASNVHADELFRPLIADPRESISRWRQSSYTSDWRYGTDITDSLSTGGYIEDRTGVQWEIAAGHTFRWRPLRRFLGLEPPWQGYQLGAPAAIFAEFESDGSLLNTDYQFGASIEIQWNGDLPRPDSQFERALWTSRLSILHRSSHLGDEYLALGAFGENQEGHPDNGTLFEEPPVKRVDLTYETLEALIAFEWAPQSGNASARAYVGGEKKFLLPSGWGIGARRPANFESPTARVGLEWRSAGNAFDPPDGWVTRAINALARDALVESGWIAALDLRWARPYEFASCDNPTGFGEVWTPHLWTTCPYGREFNGYAGSWRGMIGAAILPRRFGSSEWVVALEWYRGYSPTGQFLDQPLRYRPRSYVVPSITAKF